MFCHNLFRLALILCLMAAWPPALHAKEPVTEEAAEEEVDTYELLTLFGDVFERVREDYVEEVPEKKLIESAISGMLSSLDPHSAYLEKKAFKEVKIQTKGEFGGLGIEVTMENGLVKVVSPIDDTPAHKAGIEPGDYISQIDEEQVMGMTLSEAVQKMRGKVGTEIHLTVLREGEQEPLDFVIVRDIIKIRSVRFRPEKDVGYIRITSFSEQTYTGLEDAIASLKKDIGSEMKGYVLDLRNNPGGLLDQAIVVSDAFLERGEIVSTRGRHPEDTKRFQAEEGDLTEGLPIIVLINNGSASASEIVAGALQDHDRAIIMGTASFGKGSVQTVIPISRNSAIRITTSRYYTPSGRSIQLKGIEPDIIVEQAKVDRTDAPTKLRKEKDLRGRLANDQDEEEEETKPQKSEKNKEDASDEKKKQDEEDYQLSRALDMIRGIAFYRQQLASHTGAPQ